MGDVHIVKITSRDPSPPPIEYVKVSGGIFCDMMIHDFDLARYLSGSEVVEVFANGAVLVDEEIGKAGDVDTAIVTLKFANGAIGVIDNSRQAVYGYDQRAEVFGSKGCIDVENENLQVRDTAMLKQYVKKNLFIFSWKGICRLMQMKSRILLLQSETEKMFLSAE